MSEQAYPFPRTPDGEPDAWLQDHGRFTEKYEDRAEELWVLAESLGYNSELVWAGSEDGEVLRIFDSAGETRALLCIEDPSEQETIDAVRAAGREALREWLSEYIEQWDVLA